MPLSLSTGRAVLIPLRRCSIPTSSGPRLRTFLSGADSAAMLAFTTGALAYAGSAARFTQSRSAVKMDAALEYARLPQS